MSKKDKLIASIQNNPKNVSFETLKKVLEQNGFILRSVKGSHHTFKRDKEKITIPYHNPIKVVYVKLALEFITGEQNEKD